MATLYFILYLLAFVSFVFSAAATWRQPGERYPWAALLSLGLALWVLVLVIDAGRALNN